MNLSAEGLEQSTAYVELEYQQLHRESEAMTELLNEIKNAFRRRDGLEWRRLRTLAKVRGRTQTVVMTHWYIPDLTLTLGLAFSWSLLYVTRHVVQLYIREDGALVKRAINSDQHATGVTSKLDLQALNLEERLEIARALNAYRPS